ncbi:MAG: sulfur carrier protein ThiS, partial [candidate division Zixibacteria bacterium]|nr:sulfur carrier protein ThiS [candidate division Zixibacteria bacterium]
MEVTINGERRELPAGINVSELLERLSVDASRVVVELNRDVLPRERYDATPVAEGDFLELVEI